MAKQIIDIGTSANKGDGDPLRTAFRKINENFTELYAANGDADGAATSVLPSADATYNLGSADKQWADVFIADFIYLNGTRIEVNSNGALLVGGSNPIQTQDTMGSVFGDDSTLLVDGVNNLIPSSVIQGTEATNWDTAFSWGDHATAGYAPQATTYTKVEVDAAIAAVDPFSGDVTGSVFADDSTLLVDGVNGKITGEVTGTISSTNWMAASDSYLTIANGGSTGPGPIQIVASANLDLSAGAGQVINANRNIVAAEGVTGDVKGSVFGDDSTLLVDAVNSVIPKAVVEDSANWDTAFAWGDHSAAGYADGTNEANWDTAFSWGDHAAAGYLTSETDSQTLSLVGTDLSITNGNTVDLSGFLTSYTETDPVVGAITGIVKADGAGNISAAVDGIDYLKEETDPVVGAVNGLVKADGAGNISAAVAGTDYLTSVAFADLTATPTTIAGYGITDAFDGTYASLSGSPTALSDFSNDLDYAGIVGGAIQANGLPSGTEVTDGIFAKQGQLLSIGYKDLGGQTSSIVVDETNGVQFWKDVTFDNVTVDFTTSSIVNTPFAETANLATVATSGDYDDLTNKPTDLVRTTMTSAIDANSFDISNLFAITLQTQTSAVIGATEGTVVIADGSGWDPLGNGRKSMVVYLGGAWREIAAVPGV